MRQLLASIFTLLLTAAIALALDPQTKAEIDELISYVQTSGVRFIRKRQGVFRDRRCAVICVDKLAKAGDRVKTTDDFINGIASKSYHHRQTLPGEIRGWSHSAHGRLVAGAPGRDAEEQTVNADRWPGESPWPASRSSWHAVAPLTTGRSPHLRFPNSEPRTNSA